MAKILVEILGDAASLERAYRRAAADTNKFHTGVTRAGKEGGRAFEGLGRAAELAGGAIGIGGLAEAAKASFERMTEMQRTSAQTAAALKSTHDVAGTSAEEIDKLSESMMKLSGTDSEQIHSGENVLLMFTRVRNEVGKGNDIFNQASLAALNLSSRLGINMAMAAKLVGKALDDPIKGLGALRRVGVQFTADQTKQIKAMVLSGHAMEAQKTILAALQVRFGGAARAAGETLTGKLNILKYSLLDMGAKIAGQLAPAITRLVGQITNWISKSQNQKMIMDIVKGAMSALTTAVRILRGAFQFLSSIVGGNANAVKLLAAAYATFKFAKIASSIAGLASGFIGLTVAEGEATVATEGLSIALGPAVLVAGALAAGAALGALLMQIGPVRDAVNGLADDIGSLFGVNMKAPAAATAQRNASSIRREALALETGGLTTGQAVTTLAAQHPTVPLHDIQVLAGVYAAKPPQYYVNQLHVHGVQNPKQLHEQIVKVSRSIPLSRSNRMM